LDRGGRLPAVRSERRKAKALSWLLDHVELVDEDGNAVSREALTVDPGEAVAAGAGSERGNDEQGSGEVQDEEGATVEAES
jgi:hypothetical protein